MPSFACGIQTATIEQASLGLNFPRKLNHVMGFPFDLSEGASNMPLHN